MIALSGVRSSCDMFARNSLLSRFASAIRRFCELELDRALADLFELAALAQIDDRGADQAIVPGEPHELELDGNRRAVLRDQQPLERRDLGSRVELLAELVRDGIRRTAIGLRLAPTSR